MLKKKLRYIKFLNDDDEHFRDGKTFIQFKSNGVFVYSQGLVPLFYTYNNIKEIALESR